MSLLKLVEAGENPLAPKLTARSTGMMDTTMSHFFHSGQLNWVSSALDDGRQKAAHSNGGSKHVLARIFWIIG